MHEIGIAGLSYRNAGAEAVARFALPKSEVAGRLPRLREALGAAEVVYLATCNRVEVLYAMAPGTAAGDGRPAVFRELLGREPGAGEAQATLRAWTGEAAVEHVFLVACGLDSAQAGEQEIAVQLRGAWDTARAAGVCGPALDRVLGEALAMAREAHRLKRRAESPSLADLAVERLLEIAGERVREPGFRAALVGVSPMTRRAGRRLHERGVPLTIVNRSPEAARDLAQELGGEALPLDEFRARPEGFAAVLCAIGASEPVLGADVLSRLAKSGAIVVDFGLPPNVDPQAARRAGIERIGMDDLIGIAAGRRLGHLLELAPVRAAVDERLARLRAELATRAIGPQLAGLRGDFEHIAATEIDRLLAADLRGLDEAQREKLRRWAVTMARRLAHLPLAGIKAAAEHASPETVEAFFREARLRRVPHRE